MSEPGAPLFLPLSDPTASCWRADAVIDGRFQVIRELGHGGMGAVYLVFDLELCREVALKRIHPAGVGDANHEERFRREYRALAAIRDPGVPHVHHSGRTADGTAWFAMEAVRGESLRSILARDRLAPARALGLAIELGKILAVAHEAGVIHRDVKPNNVMIEPGDRVRLLDFGVCTPLPRFLRAAEARRRTAHVDRWESGEQQFAGTVGYSDPATYDGEPATVRSDIYSLGAIVYEMLTRRRLFDPDSMARRHIDSAEFPVALGTLAADLGRATALSPFERQRSMAELVQCLEIALGQLARAEAEAAERRRGWWRLVSGLLLGINVVLVLNLEVAPVVATPAPVAAVPVPPPPFPPPPVPPPAATPAVPTPTPVVAEAAVAPPRRGTGRPLALARRSLDRRSADVAACSEAGGTPTRQVSVVLDVAPDGRIRGLRLATGERSKLSRCIAAALADMSFPPGTPPSLTHTFELDRP